MAVLLEQPTTTPLPTPRRRHWGRFSVGEALAWLLLVGLSILFLVPFFWMLSTSLKDFSDLAGANWIPNPIVWDNYAKAFSFGMWGRWTVNTVIITVVSWLLSVVLPDGDDD